MLPLHLTCSESQDDLDVCGSGDYDGSIEENFLCQLLHKLKK